MEWSDTALVLGLGRFREADVWLRLLTRRHGLTHVFAFGGSRSRRRFPGCLDVLNRLKVRVAAGRGGQFLNLQEATLTAGPRRLRTDAERLGLAMNCLRFLEAVDILEDGSEPAYDLAGAVLDLLETAESVPERLALWFRMRIVSEQGYAPDFMHCSQCGAPLAEGLAGAEWNVPDGSVRCLACAAKAGGAERLEPGMLAALAAFQQDPPEAWRVEGLPAEERQTLVRLVDEFIEYHLGIRWERGRFIKA